LAPFRCGPRLCFRPLPGVFGPAPFRCGPRLCFRPLPGVFGPAPFCLGSRLCFRPLRGFFGPAPFCLGPRWVEDARKRPRGRGGWFFGQSLRDGGQPLENI
jgi:hypothetical protein